MKRKVDSSLNENCKFSGVNSTVSSTIFKHIFKEKIGEGACGVVVNTTRKIQKDGIEEDKEFVTKFFGYTK